MTTYTRQEIREHLKDALADNWSIEARADHLINALGLNIKPEPGFYHTDEGALARVWDSPSSGHRFLTVLDASSQDEDTIFYPKDVWPELTPVRVVSEAEWKDLHEQLGLAETGQQIPSAKLIDGQVGGLWDESLSRHPGAHNVLNPWAGQSLIRREVITATVNEALRKSTL